jgi:3-oxoadipate enol-lactonase
METTVPTAHLNGIDLNYEFDGSDEDGPVVVLVNGLADDLDSWAFQVPALRAAGLRVLRFDNRGIGKTDAPAGPYTSRQLADDAKALVDHLGLSDFHLMGVSMGGMIAQEYALAHPGDLRSLTLACTYAAPGPFCSRLFGIWSDLAQELGLPMVMRDVALWAFTVEFFESRPTEAMEFEEALAGLTMSLAAYLSQLNVIQTHDSYDRLAEITVPTLVLVGEEDILIPVRLSRTMHAGIPSSEFRAVPGGHACLWEAPDEFNEALTTFMAAH